MIKELNHDDLQQVNGGGFWDIVLDVVLTPPVAIVLDNWINPSKAGDFDLSKLAQGGVGGHDSGDGSGGQDGSGGVGGSQQDLTVNPYIVPISDYDNGEDPGPSPS